MSMIENPPAFPMASDILGHHEGMTLRDWFAGQALAIGYAMGEPPHETAQQAYSYADAMLAERSKGDEA